jgi:muramoyltetrapeptide carboxypeptidase
LLSAIDYDALKKDPKVFIGFSDITSLHGAFLTKSGVTTLHGPTVATAYVYEDQIITPESDGVLRHVISQAEPLGSLRDRMKWDDGVVYKPGKAKGRLIGGNLSVFAGLLGTPYCPDPKGCILILEETGEEPYKLDRYLTQLINAGWTEQLSGMVLGQFSDAEPSVETRDKVDVVVPRLLQSLNLPILGNFPFGHVPHNATLPFGCEAELDSQGVDLIVTESYAKA